ncbi:Aldo/keto reductase [Atractiella rhizophila]|nr:Aldo/keto reductase [Atractiella rhizophila]
MSFNTSTSFLKLNDGHSMPVIGLGVFENPNCEEACIEAFQCGYRHIDTAQIYKNETAVGNAIRKCSLARDEVFITTKLKTKFYAKRPSGKKPHSYEKTLLGVKESLANLGVDYIDLFLIHSPHGGKDARLKTWEGLEICRKEGKIKSIGVSNYGVHHLREIEMNYPETKICVNQIELSPFCQQKDIVQYCRKHEIVVSAYSPLIRGQNHDHPILTDIAKRNNATVAQVLIRWSLQKGYNPLPKSATPSRIKENFDVFNFTLSEEDMKTLDTLDLGKEGAVTWNPVDID